MGGVSARSLDEQVGQRRGVTTPSKHAPPPHPAGRAQIPPEYQQGDTGITARSVDAYLQSRLSHPQYAGETSVQRAMDRAKEAGLPDIAVSPMQGQFLSILLKSMQAKRVLEIGTLGGYSTSFLSKALPADGQIDTIELSPEHARVAQQNFIDADLFPFPAVHVGPALEVLRDPTGPFARLPGQQEGEPNPGYDVCFVDANKEQMLEYWLECLRLTRRGGLIILDNAIRQGRVASEDVDANPDCIGFRRMYDWVEKDDGRTVLMSALQTVGAKSWE